MRTARETKASFEQYLDRKMEGMGYRQSDYVVGTEGGRPTVEMVEPGHASLRQIAERLRPDFNAAVRGGKLVLMPVRQQWTVGASERELVAAARAMLGTDFPTQDAMDKYLEEHPDADRSKHKVVKDKAKETPDEVEERLKKQQGQAYRTQEQRTQDEKGKWDKKMEEWRRTKKSHVAAGAVRVGDVCEVDVAKAMRLLDEHPLGGQHLKAIVRDVARQGGGRVVVESVDDRSGAAFVHAHGNPVSAVVGGVDVPLGALKVVRGASLRDKVVSRRLVASEVVEEMARQVLHFREPIRKALSGAFGGSWALFRPFAKESDDTVVVKFKTVGTEDEQMAGFRMKYDYGSDTYVFTPFTVFGMGPAKWGRASDDFYWEDLGDRSKLEYLFETARP